MADTDSKRTKIAKPLGFIDTRLTELEEDKEELKDFLEKERRCLELSAGAGHRVLHLQLVDLVGQPLDLVRQLQVA